MAVFPQGLDQLTGDTRQDIQMLYQHIAYMMDAIERAHSMSVKNNEAVVKKLTAVGKELSANG